MPPTLADRILRIRWVVLLAIVALSALLGPTLSGSLRPTVRFDLELESLVRPEGELTIDWDSSESMPALLVRRWNADGTAIILGRVPVGAGEDFGMVCDAATSDPKRYLFGTISRIGGETMSDVDLIGYLGPPAVGARFGAGLYLLALEPGALDPAAEIALRRSDRTDLRTARVFDDIVRYGKHEPSGCFIA